MKKLSAKILISTTALSMVIAVGAVAYASSALKKVTAYQNSNIQIEVNGKAINIYSEGSPMYPLVYDGHSYVSAKALAEALGATVKWNNGTQTIEISTDSAASDAGIPSKDNSTNVPAPTPSTETPKTESKNTEHTVSGGFPSKISSDFNKDKFASQNKEYALAFFKAFADAVKTEDYASLDSFVNASIGNPGTSHFWDGPKGSIENLHKKVEGMRNANKKDILSKWADAINSMTVSDVEISSTYKSDITGNVQYSVRPKGFDAFSSLDVQVSYSIPYKQTDYWLEKIAIY
ncbi:stalk domain-containing protein [Paenibacillus puldeungensis]|uniref:Stalk domain-containing protein n=1 Tax=Paenibacillus puldeungensis TaxID=696536 RepID=A0ABW3RTF8_9BACL